MTAHRRAEAPSGGTRRSPIATAVWWTSGLALAVAVVGVVVLSVGTFTGRLSVQTVPTGSMEPAIAKGSAIVVDPVPVSDVVEGDVIVFAAPTTGTMTVHRVVGVEQGDELGVLAQLLRGDAQRRVGAGVLAAAGARRAVRLLGEPVEGIVVEDDDLLVGGQPQVDLDCESARDRSGNGRDRVLDPTPDAIVVASVGNRPGGQPVESGHPRSLRRVRR